MLGPKLLILIMAVIYIGIYVVATLGVSGFWLQGRKMSGADCT